MHLLTQMLNNKNLEANFPCVCKTRVESSLKDDDKVLNLFVSVASSVADIKSEVIPFLCHIVRHYTILGVVQQSGPCGSKPSTK